MNMLDELEIEKKCLEHFDPVGASKIGAKIKWLKRMIRSGKISLASEKPKET